LLFGRLLIDDWFDELRFINEESMTAVMIWGAKEKRIARKQYTKQ